MQEIKRNSAGAFVNKLQRHHASSQIFYQKIKS